MQKWAKVQEAFHQAQGVAGRGRSQAQTPAICSE